MTKRKRRPKVCEVLGARHSGYDARLSDEHLKSFHDLLLVNFIGVQKELQRRGMPSNVSVICPKQPCFYVEREATNVEA